MCVHVEGMPDQLCYTFIKLSELEGQKANQYRKAIVWAHVVYYNIKCLQSITVKTKNWWLLLQSFPWSLLGMKNKKLNNNNNNQDNT